jgi:hypothetical protein
MSGSISQPGFPVAAIPSSVGLPVGELSFSPPLSHPVDFSNA